MEEFLSRGEKADENLSEESDDGDENGEDKGDMAVQVDQFFSELDIDYSRQRKRLLTSGIKAPRRKSLLPTHLHSVMGNANLRLARGDSSGAVVLCKEVIRQAPHASEPYYVLATVYEDTEDKHKLLQILLILAHLKRSDSDLWLKAGDLAIQLQDPTLAVQCLSKACRLEPKNVHLHWQQANLYSEIKESKKALETYEHVLTILPSTPGRDYVECSKQMARLYHDTEQTDKATETLVRAYSLYPSDTDEEAVNILSELYIHAKQYQEGCQLIMGYYNMLSEPCPPVSTDFESLPLTTALRLSMADEVDDIPRGVESSHQGEGEPPESLLQPIYSKPDQCGDLMFEVAEAYMDVGNYSKALPLLSSLVRTDKFNQAGVWLKHAECHHMLHDMEAAALSYHRVLALAPRHTDTRLTLATLYSQMGLTEDALALLDVPATEQEEEEEGEGGRGGFSDIRVLVHKYTLLVNEGRVEEYCAVGTQLLAFLFRDSYNRTDLRVIMHLGPRKRNARLREMRDEFAGAYQEQENILRMDEWWRIFVTTCQGLYSLGTRHHPTMLHLALCAYCWRKFDTPELYKVFYMFSASVCFLMDEVTGCFWILRRLCLRTLEDSAPWNFFNFLPLDNRTQKFVLRLLFKHPNNSFLMWIHGNYSYISGNYKLALSLYERVYRTDPGNYLLCLCIAVVYLSLASQRRHSVIKNTNALVVQAMTFLHKYYTVRGHCQETLYNVGRAFHQLGQVHLACHYYKQVLVCEPQCRNGEAYDLKCEAAFNLSLIYQSSGNKALAYQVLRQFCTI
ncbi:hypothetical protein EMCRGX_G034460 [Ephydatia muelleri]